MVYKLDAGMGTMKNFKLFYEFPENFVWMDWFKSNIGSPRKTLNSVCFLQNLFRGQVIQTTARKTTWKSYEHLRYHSCVLSRNLAENLVILLCNTWRESLAVKQCIVYLDVDKIHRRVLRKFCETFDFIYSIIWMKYLAFKTIQEVK